MYYIVGYTLNNQDFALRSWYLDSVWAIEPGKDGSCNIFKNHKIAEKYYKKAHVEFRKNLKEEYRGGRIWIRKLTSSKNPFIILDQIDPKCYDMNRCGWQKVKFDLKKKI